MRKSLLIAGILLAGVFAAVAVLFLVPNRLGVEIVSQAKARGYLTYTPDEAVTLAYRRCSGCHSDEKILLYCSRCGPPFIVVSHFMRKYVELTNQRRAGIQIEPFTDAELIAITQVWNGLIGNWESDWPRKDLTKLLAGDKALVDLLDTPVENRALEAMLMNRSAPGSYKEETSKGFRPR